MGSGNRPRGTRTRASCPFPTPRPTPPSHPGELHPETGLLVGIDLWEPLGWGLSFPSLVSISTCVMQKKDHSCRLVWYLRAQHIFPPVFKLFILYWSIADCTTGNGNYGVRNGNPLQYSCLENPMTRGAWQIKAMGSQRVGDDWVAKHACMHA